MPSLTGPWTLHRGVIPFFDGLILLLNIIKCNISVLRVKLSCIYRVPEEQSRQERGRSHRSDTGQQPWGEQSGSSEHTQEAGVETQLQQQTLLKDCPKVSWGQIAERIQCHAKEIRHCSMESGKRQFNKFKLCMLL